MRCARSGRITTQGITANRITRRAAQVSNARRARSQSGTVLLADHLPPFRRVGAHRLDTFLPETALAQLTRLVECVASVGALTSDTATMSARGDEPNGKPRGTEEHVFVDFGCEAWSHASFPGGERLDVRGIVEAGDCAGLANASLIILGSTDMRGEATPALAAGIREQLPHIPIFICTLPDGQRCARLCDYAWAGADQVFTLGTDSDWRSLEVSVRRRLRCPVPEHALRTLATEVPNSPGLLILLWGLRSGWMQRGQAAVSAMFELDVKTVNKKLNAIRFPPIGTVFRVSAILHAAIQRNYEANGRQIAANLGFNDPSPLSRKRRTVERQRLAGLPGVDRLLGLLSGQS